MDNTTRKIPVWLDCDPGHDDAFAILLAAYHPAIELLGISTVHGNSSVDHTTENAGSILTAIGRPDIPVFPGAGQGISRPSVHASTIHGESGLDGTLLLPRPAIPPIRSIIPFFHSIAAALLETPFQTAWIVTTGTLTNIAKLFDVYPELAHRIKGISIMGGAIGNNFTSAPLGKVGSVERFGNWTPFAEFNIVVDPEAADKIFENPILRPKTTLIPLDVTHLVLATPAVQSLLLHGPNPDPNRKPSTLRIMFVELLTFFANTYASVFGITAGPPLHDPLAVAAILDGIPGHEIPFYDYDVEGGEKEKRDAEAQTQKVEGERGLHRERFEVQVLTQGTHEEAVRGETQTGRTQARPVEKGARGVKIPRGLDVERFWTVLEECLQRADEKNALAG